jgi:hypothetical protein
MIWDEWRVQLTHGEGEVHRDGATVLVVGSVEPKHDAFLRELLAAVAAASLQEPTGPGKRVARSCAGLLSQAVPDSVPDLGIISADVEGVVILLVGDTTVEVTHVDGEVLHLSSRDVASWVDRHVRAPFQQLSLHVGPPGATAVRSDLRAGVVNGGGVLLTVAGDVPEPAATTEIDLDPVAFPEPSPVVAPESEPAPAVATDFVAFSLTGLSPEEEAPPLGGLDDDHAHADEPADIEVEGIRCSRGHFNDPRSRFCSSCGISMVQQTHDLVSGRRPSLGVLVLDDGSAYSLTNDYILGREPANAPEVLGGAALPLTLIDPDLTMSRIHARITMTGWDVRVADAGSANGTFVAAPGNDWTRLNPEEPVTIVPATRVRVGERTLVFDSSNNQGHH